MGSISVPPSLKKIKVFLTHANELDRDKSNPESRVLAYNCRQYAVHIGISLAGGDSRSRECLGMILGQLEKEKDAMSVFSKEEHWQICRKVADRVLDNADVEDRAGQANKLTAKSFYAAATFFEVLQQFYPGEGEEVNDEVGDQITEEERRRIYCKWKATDILNAVKEGRTPTPGGYQQLDDSTEEKAMSPSTKMTTISAPTRVRMDDLPPPPRPIAVSYIYEDQGIDNGINSKFTTTAHSPDNIGSVGGFEVNLDGDAAPASPSAEDLEAGNATEGNISSLVFADAASQPTSATTMSQPDCSVRRDNESATSVTSSLPSKSKPRSPSPVATAPRTTSSSTTTNGIFSSITSSFNKSSSTTTTTTTATLSKAQVADAIELTKFALSALQKGDAEMGRERLEQALGVWRR